MIDAFREKSDTDGDLINIGFMVFEPTLFDYIEGDLTVFEKGPLSALVEKNSLLVTFIKVTGSAWIPFVKNNSWKNCGIPAMHPGNCGRNNEFRFKLL